MTRLTAGDFLTVGHGYQDCRPKPGKWHRRDGLQASFVTEARFDSSESNISKR
jgi:hypothetical protein